MGSAQCLQCSFETLLEFYLFHSTMVEFVTSWPPTESAGALKHAQSTAAPAQLLGRTGLRRHGRPAGKKAGRQEGKHRGRHRAGYGRNAFPHCVAPWGESDGKGECIRRQFWGDWQSMAVGVCTGGAV